MGDILPGPVSVGTGLSEGCSTSCDKLGAGDSECARTMEGTCFAGVCMSW